jgi:hypothetical protein
MMDAMKKLYMITSLLLFMVLWPNMNFSQKLLPFPKKYPSIKKIIALKYKSEDNSKLISKTISMFDLEGNLLSVFITNNKPNIPALNPKSIYLYENGRLMKIERSIYDCLTSA